MRPLIAIALIAACAGGSSASAQKASENCDKPLYLTFDTGHMGVAPLVADVLKRHHVRVTFFAAHERTKEGDGSLGKTWAPWWKARAAEGHEFASHTWQHAYWRGDAKPEGGEARYVFLMSPLNGYALRTQTGDTGWVRIQQALTGRRLDEV